MGIFEGIEAILVVTCDFCSKEFPAPITHPLPADFDALKAAAICPDCGSLLARLFGPPRDEDGYQRFVERCARSVARKLGVGN